MGRILRLVMRTLRRLPVVSLSQLSVAISELENRLLEVINKAGDGAVKNARVHTEAAVAAAVEVSVSAAREHAEAMNSATIQMLDLRRNDGISELHRQLVQGIAEVRRSLHHVETQIRLQADGIRGEMATKISMPEKVSSVLYADIEDRFRGDQDDIAARQSVYLADVRAHLADGGVLVDIGSGRGEWLARLQAEFPAATVAGIDANELLVAEAQAAGLTVAAGDAIVELRRREVASCDVVTMFHVAEHLALEEFDSLCAEVSRVLREGGLFICETPNCASLSVGAATFWIDPTHSRPLHPDVLQFVVQRAGFSHIEFRELNPVTPTEMVVLAGDNPTLQGIISAIWGNGDVAVLARR